MTDVTLDITLTGSLLAQLEHPGVSAYAVWFDQSQTTPQWTVMIDNGTLLNAGSIVTGGQTLASGTTVALPSSLNGGKIYILIQSQDTASPIGNLTTIIKSQSDISWNSASLYDFRYDSMEVTLSGSGTDAGNLTSVNGFGLPMELSTNYVNITNTISAGITQSVTSYSSASAGYAITGDTVAQDIGSISANADYAYSAGPLAGGFRAAVSPTTAVGQTWPGTIAAFSTQDWVGYVTSLESVTGIQISGLFNGAEDGNGIYHNAGYFAYDVSFDGTNFDLTPESSSQIQGTIVVSPGDLENSIYSTLGTMQILQPNGSLYTTENTGWNDQWGKVMSEFLIGFTGGYYEVKPTPINPQLSGTIDLNTNINWDPTYAFGTISPGTTFQSNDPYAKLFFEKTNSYGAGYSDALMSAYTAGGPLMSVSQGVTNVVNNSGTITQSVTPSNVSQINLTIFADGETPTGYTPAVIYNYIAPTGTLNPGGEYNPATTIIAGNNVNLNFAANANTANTVGVVLDKNAEVIVNILKSDSGGVPIWNTVTIDGATAGTLGLWQNWTFTGDSTNGYTATASSANQPSGSMLLVNLPTAQDGVSWYQIVVNQGTVAGKTFNLYTTTSGGKFENPAASNQAGALAADGLASISLPAGSAPPSATIQTFTINFASGSASTLDPLLLDVNSGNVLKPTPNAPVAGVMNGQSFQALVGQTLQVSNTITTTNDDIAFAWTGMNNTSSNTVSWISGYTNKIDALQVARVEIDQMSGTAVVGTTLAAATSGIDGTWLTAPVHLNPGTYQVTVQEFAAGDTAYMTPLSNQGSMLLLDIEAPCFLPGTMIRTPAGDVPVERLAPGDLVQCLDGRSHAITWIGKGRVLAPAGRRTAATPVIVRRDALAPNVPDRDLHVTKGHAFYLDGVLIPSEFLVNHRSILWDDRGQEVTVYHIELQTHEVLLANGAPAESYRYDGNRWMFQNAHDRWDDTAKPAYAPVLTGGAIVDAVWRRLLDRCGPVPAQRTTRDPDLHLLVDGVRVDGDALADGGRVFRLRQPPRTARLVSRAAAQDMMGRARDPRILGVAVQQIMLWHGRSVRVIEADDACLTEGFHAFEADNGFRWTDGAALVPPALFTGVSGACELQVRIAATTHYPVSQAPDRQDEAPAALRA